MKKIYLVRHAKSSWSNSNLPDIDRPLNERGYRNAHEMAHYLKVKKYDVGPFISSTAIRAITTALIFSRAGLISQNQVNLAPDLYESSPDTYLRIIREQSDEHATIFIFAHNPTISEFSGLLCGDQGYDMSTCDVVVIEIPVEKWADVSFGIGLRGEIINKAGLGAM
ncbi:MAG TPA: histidine phosphatase family protein [Bacteroidia bacterium]|nr:histidine phosphatase family protein [Bacteroidia bacterium]HNS12294.1 histidine phosphatase family protein [Bacteroidia bacterium]